MVDLTGADYDMSECTPGDLDPHAVASIFKAYLRECKCIHSESNCLHLVLNKSLSSARADFNSCPASIFRCCPDRGEHKHECSGNSQTISECERARFANGATTWRSDDPQASLTIHARYANVLRHATSVSVPAERLHHADFPAPAGEPRLDTYGHRAHQSNSKGEQRN